MKTCCKKTNEQINKYRPVYSNVEDNWTETFTVKCKCGNIYTLRLL